MPSIIYYLWVGTYGLPGNALERRRTKDGGRRITPIVSLAEGLVLSLLKEVVNRLSSFVFRPGEAQFEHSVHRRRHPCCRDSHAGGTSEMARGDAFNCHYCRG